MPQLRSQFVSVARRLQGSPTVRFAPGRLVPAVITVVSTPILARLLSKEDFGQLALIQSVALLAASGIFGWLEVTVVRSFASAGTLRGSDTSFLVGPGLVGGGLMLLAGATIAAATGSSLPFLGAGCAVAYATTLGATALARARHAPSVFTTVATVGLCARYVLGLPLLAVGFGLDAVLVSWILGGFLALVIASSALIREPRGVRVAWPSRSQVTFGAPVLLVQTGLLALALIDRVILAAHVSPAGVAPYALGYSLLDQASSLITSILMAAQFPAMIRLFDKAGPESARPELQRTIGVFLRFSVPALVILALYGDDLARAFGGSQYADANFAFVPWVAGGLFFLGFHQYLTVPLQQRRETVPWAIAVACGLGINVGLNFALIPSMGTTAAGIATFVGYGAVVAVLLGFVGREVRMPWRTVCASALAASVGVATAKVTAVLPWVVAAALSFLLVLAVFALVERGVRRRAA